MRPRRTLVAQGALGRDAGVAKWSASGLRQWSRDRLGQPHRACREVLGGGGRSLSRTCSTCERTVLGRIPRRAAMAPCSPGAPSSAASARATAAPSGCTCTRSPASRRCACPTRPRGSRIRARSSPSSGARARARSRFRGWTGPAPAAVDRRQRGVADGRIELVVFVPGDDVGAVVASPLGILHELATIPGMARRRRKSGGRRLLGDLGRQVGCWS